MRRPLALAAGALAAVALLKRISRRPAAIWTPPGPAEPPPDPRAAELRQRLAESRSIVEERDEFEEAETPVDRVDVGDRRRAVHDDARSTLERMRGAQPPG